MTSKIEKLEKLLSEAAQPDYTMEKELVLLSTFRNSAPLLLEIVKAAKGLAHGTDWNNGTHSAIYRSKLIDALKKFEESDL